MVKYSNVCVYTDMNAITISKKNEALNLKWERLYMGLEGGKGEREML